MFPTNSINLFSDVYQVHEIYIYIPISNYYCSIPAPVYLTIILVFQLQYI